MQRSGPSPRSRCWPTGCGDDTATADGELAVATTVSPITSIAAQIGGDRVDVTGIVPEGTNSHTFEPRPSVAELLSTVDVLFVNGLGLEEPTTKLAESTMKSGGEIVELGTRAIPERDYVYDFSFPRSGGKPNPHLWTDPRYALKYARVIRDTFVRRDPRNAAYYDANLRRFGVEVGKLDRAMRASFATIPRARRKLLTYHDAYAYFAAELRLGRHRRDPGLGLRRPDGEGRRGADRAGPQDEGARDLRLGGLPEPRARADRRRDRRAVRRRPARRRPAGRPGRAGALVAGPDALRLHHDDRGARRRRRPAARPASRAPSAPDRAEYPQ